jgi:hypothetical protein
MKHIHQFENYDAPGMNQLPKSEINRLAKLEFPDKFEIGGYYGRNSSSLNSTISNAQHGYGERLNPLDLVCDTVKRIFKDVEFEVKYKEDKTVSGVTFEVRHEIGFLKFQRFMSSIYIHVSYNHMSDELMDRAKGQYELLFAPTISRSRISYSPSSNEEDRETADILRVLSPAAIEDAELGDYGITNVMQLLYKSPDGEDEGLKGELHSRVDNIPDMQTLTRELQKLRRGIRRFSRHCMTKYNIDATKNKVV